jgi:hypothetical protein
MLDCAMCAPHQSLAKEAIMPNCAAKPKRRSKPPNRLAGTTKTKRRPGAPSKYRPPSEKWKVLPEGTDYTPSIADVILEKIADGAGKEDAALYAGICTKTLYNWRDAHPEFLQALKKAEAHCVVDCVSAVKKGETGWQAKARMLEAIRPQQWRKTTEVKSDQPAPYQLFQQGLDDWLRQHPPENRRKTNKESDYAHMHSKS